MHLENEQSDTERSDLLDSDCTLSPFYPDFTDEGNKCNTNAFAQKARITVYNKKVKRECMSMIQIFKGKLYASNVRCMIVICFSAHLLFGRW